METRYARSGARVAYLAIILFATLMDLHFSPDRAAAVDRAVRALAEPLTWSDVIDGIRNVVLFGGLGAVWLATTRSGRLRGPILVVSAIGFALSVTVESIQTFSPVRVASLMDVITDTFGALAGALVAAGVILVVRRSKGRPPLLGAPTFLLAAPYCAAVLCEALTPLFRTSLVAGVSGGPMERWRYAMGASLPLSFLEVPVFDIALFVPAGFLAAMLVADCHRHLTRWWWLVSTAATPVIVLAHLSHGAWGLPIRWEAVTTDVLSFALGVWAAHRWAREPGAAAFGRAPVLGYALLLALWNWRPLVPETGIGTILRKLTIAGLTPLRLLAGTESVFSAVQVMQQVMLYVPLGVLLCVRPLETTGRWAHLRPAVCFAFVMELGHLVVRGRTFDITNPLLACAGLALGWLLARSAGSANG